MKKRTPELKLPGKTDPHYRWLFTYLLVLVLVTWGWQEFFGQFSVRTIPYSQFRVHLERREVVQATVKPDEVVGRIVPISFDEANGPAGSGAIGDTYTNSEDLPFGLRQALAEKSPFLFRTVRVDDPELVTALQTAGVEYGGTRPSVLSQFLFGWVLPIAVLIGLWSLVSRRMGAASEGVFGIGRSRAKLIVDNNTGVTFSEVAGCDEAKQELREVVDFLQNPDEYEAIGARIPKGALLVGPPGTGKTLLARAVAGEAGVPFFSMSGADFVEMFVGIGAARVRDLFKQAKEHAPCIIFIDELDAIGRQRGVHVGGGNDEREQTLNAMLVEMDGFEANTGVIILAATNRPEVLDRALLRPGRFDRQIVVDAPDLAGREAILKVHARNKKLATDVDLHQAAMATVGFSGADLANVLNEAALLAARRKANEVEQHDVSEAIEKVVAGPERRSRRLSSDEKVRVAYHEVGHALVAAHCDQADPVHKISIVPRGRAALGYTMQIPNEDQFLQTRSELLDQICGLLGGRAAEEIAFGEASTGAQNDLERATALARQMVSIYGMSDAIGLASCAQRQGGFLAGSDAHLQRDCSEQTVREIDDEVKAILDHEYAKAKELLTQHRGQLEAATEKLMKYETLNGAEFYELIGKNMPRKSPSKLGNHTQPRETAMAS